MTVINVPFNLPSTYRGFDVVDRPGIGPAIIIKAVVESAVISSSLHLKEDCNLLFVLDVYDVEFYSVKKEDGTTSTFIFSIKNLKGYSKLRGANEDLKLEFEIPVSGKLIDCINEIRRNARLLGLIIRYSFRIAKLHSYEHDIMEAEGYVEKILPSGEKHYVMMFFTEEMNEIMRKLGYAELVRFEIPIPLIPEARIEILSKSATELKSAEEKIAKGDYPEALNVLRNIIMNYLTESEKEKGRVLKEELEESIISSVPSDLKGVYEKILKGIENALLSNLEHIHKFIKEDTGKLIAMPSREEAEYVYLMLIAILRYLSQLIIRWRGKY
jgi:hypothetical protein